jgi:hypothetical protein
MTHTFTPTGSPTNTYTISPTVEGTPTPTFTPTNTAIFTMTNTFTVTSTVTSTVTMTGTPTPTPTGTAPLWTRTWTPTYTPSSGATLIYVPYPNPVRGTRVTITVPGNFPTGSLKVQVYTLSGRLVETLVLPLVLPDTEFTLDLISRAGNILSNGFYYIRLTASNGQRSIIKLLVLR